MNTRTPRLVLIAFIIISFGCAARPAHHEPSPDARLDWWREARFGLFVHWGLYAVPAGRWGESTGHGEWIRETARIPVSEYDKLLARFDPRAFDADIWARLADEAGMEYIVITTKHHDGFALFDSAVSEFDVAATPWKKDVMAEIARSFGSRGLHTCWYHSIMDWHHPDYLPRRGWEAADRSAEGADFERYLEYLHAQVTELLTHYGPIGVMWFDGEWESTWNHPYGQALYDLCRRLQPDVIVNNRVDVGRSGMAGMTDGPGFAGDFGTPEQEVPATGFPGVDWESCITMNGHWGWNEADRDWKSTTELVRLLVDVVSKGGNLLLNVGPRADGTFPPQAVERMEGIARWMKLHGEAIHGTRASPFTDLGWGRCTQKRDGSDTRLFLHVFDWPIDGKLIVPGLGNDSFQASLLANGRALTAERAGPDLWVWLPEQPTDVDCPVVELRVKGEPVIYLPPHIESALSEFVTPMEVRITSPSPQLEVRYRLDGGEPQARDPLARGPITLRESTVVTARAFHHGRAVTPVVRREFRRVEPRPAPFPLGMEIAPAISIASIAGAWSSVDAWIHQLGDGPITHAPGIELGDLAGKENVGVLFSGCIRIPEDGMWRFSLTSDDGSRLEISDQLVVNNDGLHSSETREGSMALKAGWHPFRLAWFNRTGGAVLDLRFAREGESMHAVTSTDLGGLPRLHHSR